MEINKVLQTPALPCEPNSFYFVKKPDNKVDCYVSNDTADQLHKIFNSENLPSIDGPATVLIDSINEYFITDYDYRTVYTISTNIGTFEITDDVITLTAQSTEAVGELVVNGTRVPITVSHNNTAPFINMQEKGYISPIALDSYQAIREELIDTTILPDGKILIVVNNFHIQG